MFPSDLWESLHRATCLPARDVLAQVGAAQLKQALAAGLLESPAPGWYALPRVRPTLALAKARRAVLSHQSAAEHHGLDLITRPGAVHLTVPRGRNQRDKDVVLHRTSDRLDLRAGVTDVLETVLDCARTMPFAEALVVADSALRDRRITSEELRRAADQLTGRGARMARRVAQWASAQSGSAMETLVRAAMIEGRVTGWVEQHLIEAGGVRHRTDFAFPARRVVVEAEGYAFHAPVAAFTNDCARYNRLVAAGWTVVRVTWRDLEDPERLCTLLRTVLRRRPRPHVLTV
ncbi:MAG: hypothetical protein ACXVYS_13600 [Oryzihumus sp.]